jgi:predicted Co/Zn/Cd cation transporter (cation efflux family)
VPVTPSVKLNIANVQSNIAEIMPVTPSIGLNIANVQSNIAEIVLVTPSVGLNIANIQSEIGEFMLKWITTLSRPAERLYNSHHINIVETSGRTSLPMR